MNTHVTQFKITNYNHNSPEVSFSPNIYSVCMVYLLLNNMSKTRLSEYDLKNFCYKMYVHSKIEGTYLLYNYFSYLPFLLCFIAFCFIF